MTGAATGALVFGGTFDPVHNGHIEAARSLLQRLEGTELYFVPCQVPAHRPMPAAPAADRLRMLALATAGEQRMHVDDCELRRPGTSYTFDTLFSYREKIGVTRTLVFAMGRDAWQTLTTWHRWRELTDLSHLLVFSRPGTDMAETEELSRFRTTRLVFEPEELMQQPSGSICFFSGTPVDVSATGLRKKICAGVSIDGDVHPQVIKYIQQQNLYVNAAPAPLAK